MQLFLIRIASLIGKKHDLKYFIVHKFFDIVWFVCSCSSSGGAMLSWVSVQTYEISIIILHFTLMSYNTTSNIFSGHLGCSSCFSTTRFDSENILKNASMLLVDSIQ